MTINLEEYVIPGDKVELKKLEPVNLMKKIDFVYHTVEEYWRLQKKFFSNGELSKEELNKKKEDIMLAFAVWSGAFNRGLRWRMKAFSECEDKEQTSIYSRLCYVYSYWGNCYKLISEMTSNTSPDSKSEKATKNLHCERNILYDLISQSLDTNDMEDLMKKMIKNEGVKTFGPDKDKTTRQPSADKMSQV